jgi:Uma2 family endonuclease
MGALQVHKISLEENLALDRASEARSEYHDGQIFPVVATSLVHGVLQLNAGRRLAERLDGTTCHAVGAAVRVRVSNSHYVYPDVLVYCGKPALTDEHNDTITNPKVIVEVLSPSTEDYDYGRKFILYRRLESFAEYLLVSQERPRVEVSQKLPDGSWVLTTYEGLEATVPVKSLEISIPMAELYNGVEFPSVVE